MYKRYGHAKQKHETVVLKCENIKKLDLLHENANIFHHFRTFKIKIIINDYIK